MSGVEVVATDVSTVDIVAGALKGTYHADFPKATDDDWRSDAEFVLARFQEYGYALTVKPSENDDDQPEEKS